MIILVSCGKEESKLYIFGARCCENTDNSTERIKSLIGEYVAGKCASLCISLPVVKMMKFRRPRRIENMICMEGIKKRSESDQRDLFQSDHVREREDLLCREVGCDEGMLD
jgi:hypothetical protein